MSNSSIVVVGAGVIGLSCALSLVENGYKVKVVARNLPTDALTPEYTSPWAGAHFRPFPSKSEDEKREMKMTRVTQEHFKKLAIEEPHSSVRFIDGVEYFENPDSFYREIGYGYKEDIENFEIIEQNQLPEGTVLGTKYKTWVVNSPHYLRYLQNKLIFKYGVTFNRENYDSLKSVLKQYPKSIVVNATGQGLQYNGGFDPKSFPIRGQTLLVRVPQSCLYLNKTITHQSKEGLWTFVIPRPLDGGVILGGTKQLNDFQTTPKPEDTKALISRARKLYPELFIDGEIDIRNINVGFRPGREGGSRVELEKIDQGNVIHAYGAAGMGYELSYGMGQEVLKIVDQLPMGAKL